MLVLREWNGIIQLNDREYVKQLFKKYIQNKDQKSIDLILLFLYSIPSCFVLYDGVNEEIEKRKNKFRDIYSKLAIHTLNTKYNLEVNESISYIEKVNGIIDYYLDNKLEKYYKKDTYRGRYYSNFIEFSKNLFTNQIYDIFYNYLENLLLKLSDEEKEITTYIIAAVFLTLEDNKDNGYVPKRVCPYVYSAIREHLGIKLLSYLPIYRIKSSKSNKVKTDFEILYVALINFDTLLNSIQDEKLSEISSELLVANKKISIRVISNVLLKMGFINWYFSLTQKGNISPKGYNFVLPSFIVYIIMDINKKKKIGLIKRINQIKKDISTGEKIRWSNLEEKYKTSFTKKKPPFTENDIERYVISNLNEIEEGLKLIDNQYNTERVGIIDILCKDKADNFVVIEIKKGKAEDKVVGQIQRYLTWVNDNLKDKNGVRGIIICESHDKKLIASIKGSKFKIIIYEFGISKIKNV